MKDLALSLVRLAKEVVATVRKGDMYESVHGEGTPLWEKKVFIVHEIKGDTIVFRADNFPSYEREMNKQEFEKGLRERKFVKTEGKDAPTRWDYYAWLRFANYHKDKVVRTMLPTVLRLVKKIMDYPIKPMKVWIEDDKIMGARYTKNVWFSDDTFKGIKWSGELEPMNELGSSTLKNIADTLKDKLFASISRMKDRKDVELLLDDQKMTGKLVGSFVKDYRGDYQIKYELSNAGEILRELRHIEMGELQELLEEHRRLFFDKVDKAISDGAPYVIDNVKWSWDPGQKGGWDDPSWDPYVEEINWDYPDSVLIGWDDLFGSGEEEIVDDETAFYEKVLKNYGDIVLEDVEFDFSPLPTFPCRVTIKPVVKSNGVELVFNKIDPGKDTLEEAAEEHDRDNAEPPDYDDDRY